MTRGVARDAALAATPARKGRRTGQPVQPREIPFTAARCAVIAAIRRGRTGYAALTSALGKLRTIIDRNRQGALARAGKWILEKATAIGVPPSRGSAHTRAWN